MLRKSGFAPLVIIIVLLTFAFIIAVFFVYQNTSLKQKNSSQTTPSPTPTLIITNTTSTKTSIPDNSDNWRQFLGLNYSFKYPSTDFETFEYIPENDVSSLRAYSGISVAVPQSDQFILKLRIYNTSHNPSTWWKYNKHKFELIQDSVVEGNRIIDGKQALVIEGKYPQEFANSTAKISIVSDKESVYVFEVNPNLYPDGSALKYYDQILSTFKFVD